jgi:hypothetical protein
LAVDLRNTANNKVRWVSTNDTIKTVLEMQDALCQFEALFANVKALEENEGVLRLAEDLKRRQAAIHAAYGPVEDWRRAGLLDLTSHLRSEFQGLQQIATKMQAQFRLPEIAEATRLFRDWENSAAANATKRYREQASEFQRAVEAMRAPWLDIEDRIRSLGGFVELQGIGHTLRTMPAFDTHVADAIRLDLGDWRDKLAWPSEIFTDPLVRTSFYADRGLDRALTAFPAGAFEQSISIAGLKGTLPPLAEGYHVESEVEPDEAQEAGFVRTNAAHDRLQRFESQMRKFIDERMTEAFGEQWSKHQVPGDIRQAWVQKQQRARDRGEPEWPLIAYADFADYVPIITRKDNWERVFERIFQRAASVQESFQRLYPIRICTMHARLITQDDQLYLYVETKRLLTTIGMKV